MKFLPFFLFVAVFLSPFLLIADGLPNFPFLRVVGQAEIEVAPDQAEIQFRLLAFNKDAKVATDKLNEVRQTVEQLTKQMNIAKNMVESFNVNKSIIRERSRNPNRSTDILGHEVSLRYKVKLADLAHFEQLISELLKLNGLDSLNIEFDLKDRADIETKLAIAAGEDAFNQAYNMATGVNAKLGSVFSVEAGRHGQVQRFKAVSFSDGASGISRVPDVIRISKSISVMYRLKPEVL